MFPSGASVIDSHACGISLIQGRDGCGSDSATHVTFGLINTKCKKVWEVLSYLTLSHFSRFYHKIPLVEW